MAAISPIRTPTLHGYVPGWRPISVLTASSTEFAIPISCIIPCRAGGAPGVPARQDGQGCPSLHRMIHHAVTALANARQLIACEHVHNASRAERRSHRYQARVLFLYRANELRLC